MRIQKISALLVSPIGIKVSRILAMSAAVGTVGSYLLVQGIYLDKYKEIFQLYEVGVEKTLKPEIKQLADEVLQDCNLPKNNIIRFFSVYGCNPFHAGSTFLKWGGIVGIPANFYYKSPTDIEKSKIKVHNTESVEWSSEEGEKLLDSFILSKNAQKFAVAREIHYCTTNSVFSYGLLSSMCILGSYILGHEINNRYKLYVLPRKVRLALYSICSVLGTAFFFTIKDALSIYWDKYADKTAASMSLEYLNGGIEFYQKILQRNIAMRKLMGEYGEKVYTYYGNEKTLIRTKNLPYTVRLDNLKNIKHSDVSDESLTTMPLA